MILCQKNWKLPQKTESWALEHGYRVINGESTPTLSPEPTPTSMPTPSPEPTATSTPIPTPTNTPKPTATSTPIPTPTNTPKPAATSTPEPTPTNKPTSTATLNSTTASETVHVAYHTKQEIVDYIKNSGATVQDALEFAEAPVVSIPYSLGALSSKTLDSAVKMVNQIRYIAGLDVNVVLDDTLNETAQAGTLVNYINGKLSHYPEQPEGMDDAMYQLAYKGTSCSNIAWGSWEGYKLNQALVYGWMDDGDSSNIDRVAHRRWILNPSLEKVGFGSVTGDQGTYHAMYVFDKSNTAADQYGVLWPAQNMPLGYFDKSFPWSISVGSSVDMEYITVTLTRRSDDKVWTFQSIGSDGYFNVDNAGYGQRGCIIFRPDSVGSYQDGDIFDVMVTGSPIGDISYSVSFFDETTYAGE